MSDPKYTQQAVLDKLLLAPDGPQPLSSDIDSNRRWQTLEYVSPLGLSNWGIAWDDTFWAWQCQGQGMLIHEDRGFWADREPNWEIVRAEIERAGNYVREA